LNTPEKKEKMKVKADYIIVLSIYLQRAAADPAPSLEQMAADMLEIVECDENYDEDNNLFT